ncbi:MAG: hypothetical protein AUH91_00655 [Verrucomicrobia bacterium 13_1_40CM_4_54_4]|nr:MAG: hypothetical protein AUH91_00655 [Verrucomicrobia bacterium 13_1_40CM_4_54_4]
MAVSEKETAARKSGHNGQCAPSNPLTSKWLKRGSDFPAFATAARSASRTKVKPQSRTRLSKRAAISRKTDGSISCDSQPAA